jgi:quinol monooxygenase YgiN
VDAFEQVGRPGHFSLVERWPDQASLDAHRTTPHARQFQAALQPIRVSGYDERPYKPLSVAASAPLSGGRPAFVVTHVDIGGGGGLAGAPDMLRRLAEESRREPGNVRFDVVQHAMRANHFTIVEAWRDQAALDAHAAAAHTRTYREQVQPISGSPIDERVYTGVN